MNLYLSSRYSLPLPFIPISLRDICVKLSLYQLLSRKGYAKDSADSIIKTNYDAAIKQLELIAKGTLDVGIIVNNDNEPVSSSSGAVYKFPKSRFR